MLNSFYIFIQRLNQKEVRDGQHGLAVLEMLLTVLAIVIIRNT